MRYLALACDYDGTLAADGRVSEETVHSLERLRDTGRKLILVTGRELEDLISQFSPIEIFERVVAENGAVVYAPKSREERVLGDAPPESFIRTLQKLAVQPLSRGRVIVSTWEPHEKAVLEGIRELGLELQVIFNKGAVMVLPAGINKATGLVYALQELGLSPHNLVGIGDAENDHAFLDICECSAAVSNALPSLKDKADFVTQSDHGRGVVELIEKLIDNDLRELEQRLKRHHILIGTREENKAEVKISPYGLNLLLAGTSGGGKSTLAMSLLEQLSESDYQFCVIDPEGDYESFENTIVLGNNQRVPNVDEVLQVLQNPGNNAVVNLLGRPLEDRPSFLAVLLPRIQELRARLGRPHWLLLDETHHMLPWSWEAASLTLSQEIQGMIFVTVHPKELALPVLSRIDVVLAVGTNPQATINLVQETTGHKSGARHDVNLASGQALFWSKYEAESPFRLQIAYGRADRRRHRRKYAEGNLTPEKSFYFRGPEGKLNLRAHNLILFVQIAEGVDETTWLYHLRRGDYSRWFRDIIKDHTLANEAARMEKLPHISAFESRKLIRTAIEQHYTLPVSSSPASET
jgi:HAD superfamily hydrolase (TIGR01484 family)